MHTAARFNINRTGKLYPSHDPLSPPPFLPIDYERNFGFLDLGGTKETK